MTMLFAAVHESKDGTNANWRPTPQTSGYGVRPEVSGRQ